MTPAVVQVSPAVRLSSSKSGCFLVGEGQRIIARDKSGWCRDGPLCGRRPGPRNVVPGPSVMPWPCSADQDVKTSSLLSASAKSFQTISAFGSSRQPFSGDKSSAGILLSAKRRRDVAATNSADAAAAVVL